MGRLLFDSDRSGNLDIWMVGADEAPPLQITENAASDRVPTWGVAGESVIFASDRQSGGDSPTGLRAYGLWVAHLDGSPTEHLIGTQSFNHRGIPSPDGTRIAFYSDATGASQVYLMQVDGGGTPAQLTDDPIGASVTAWSPDGERLLVTSSRHYEENDGNREVYAVNVDGSGETRLTHDPGNDGGAVWSPDGTHIAFHSDRDGTHSIFVMPVSGGDVTKLTDEGGDDRFPSWSPDGSMLAFETDRDGNSEIYVMNADGSGLLNVTNDPARDGFPAWGE